MTSLPFEDLPQIGEAVSFFEDFWFSYPRKVGKLAAEKAYTKALKQAAPDVIWAGLQLYLKTKPAYADWCHPATWLNQGRWMDEPDTISALKAGISGGAYKGESLESIAAIVKRAGTTWARCRYPRDVLEQCVAAELLTVEQMEQAL